MIMYHLILQISDEERLRKKDADPDSQGDIAREASFVFLDAISIISIKGTHP